MKCAFISDLHIETPNDKASKIFLDFCRHPETLSAKKVIFLGDIFDLLIGEHSGYIEKYKFFFDEIITLLELGKEVIFIEGNHDFHFKKTITTYIKNTAKNPSAFRYLLGGEEILLNGEKYYYCHGYEVDYHNKYFKRWYNVYSSFVFKVFISNILPFFVIQKLGDWAAKNSKKRGKKAFDYDEMKEKYLEGAKALIAEKKLKGVIAGHTHVPELHIYENDTLYINNGFPVRDKFFIFFNGVEFKKIIL